MTCVKELNTPQYMSISGIVDAYQKEIVTYNHEDLQLDPKDCGLSASPTRVFRSFTPDPKGKGEMLSGTVKEMAGLLVGKLQEKYII